MSGAAHCKTMPMIQLHGGGVPRYPDFAPVSLPLQREIGQALAGARDGVSEYSFANLYLFRERYRYRISTADGALILSGQHGGERFFMIPCALPGRAVLDDLFLGHEFWKGIPDSLLEAHGEQLDRWGIAVAEDRDNFDYLYRRGDLAELPGKKYHKKRNLVNAFRAAYPCEERPLTEQTVPDALAVLDRWRQDKGGDGDYRAAREALELLDRLGLRGEIVYADGVPAGWCLGEAIAGGRVFAVHFEKGVDAFKGIYQYINQRFAASLPDSVDRINREQDLGDQGLRQAKMTYRPCGFVRKSVGRKR